MNLKELWARAEDAVRSTRRDDVAALSFRDVQHLVHDLRAHRIEFAQSQTLSSAQQELERSREQYDELFDSAPAGYLTVDKAGSITRANHAAAGLAVGQRADLIGQPLAGFIATRDLGALEQCFRDARWNSRAACEIRLRRANGGEPLVRLDISPLPSRPTDYLIVLTDMTERQRHVEVLEQMNVALEGRVAARTAELAARNRQLEAESRARERSDAQRRAAESRLREAQRRHSLGLLAAGIARDFNDLLQPVVGNADRLLLEPELPQHLHEPLAMVRHAGTELSALTQQLLVFAGRGRPRLSAVRLPLVVAGSLEQLRDQWSSDVQLQTQIAADLPAVEADRGQLEQLVMHLVTNALEAIVGHGVIAIQIQPRDLDRRQLAEFQHVGDAKPGRFALLAVEDSGAGITTENLSHIFDPFFTTKLAGRGLGLATVLGIVQSHRGALRVRSHPGEGTRFEVALPLGAPDRESERAHAPRERSPSGRRSNSRTDAEADDSGSADPRARRHRSAPAHRDRDRDRDPLRPGWFSVRRAAAAGARTVRRDPTTPPA